MSQTRKGSIIESIVNVIVGALIAFVSNTIIFSSLSIPVSNTTNLTLTVWYTAISLARSYTLRRIFNAFKN